MIVVAESPKRVRQTVRREYRRPPVHEVVLSLQFAEPVDLISMAKLRDELRPAYSEVEEQQQIGMEMTFGPGGQQLTQTKREADGWLLKDDPKDPSRVLSIGRSRLSVHAVRPGSWPTGEYAGWAALYEHSLQIVQSLARIYGAAKLEKAGLRYLNRIAVPQGTELFEWFVFRVNAPEFLQDEYGINLRQTWARVEGADDLSATVGLATIQIPEPSLAAQHIGFLLDIEVFNLWKPLAPTLSALPDWCARAHEVEGDIFEWSITDSLRNLFDPLK